MSVPENCDVCIVGTGAGGGILAYNLAMAGLNVVSLEQGELLPNSTFQNGDPRGGAKDFGIQPDTIWPADPHDSLFVHPLFADGSTGSTSRSPGSFRHFQVYGVDGLQNLWNGVSVRFSKDDFQAWPFDYDTLAPHYAAVERLITVCGTNEQLPELPDGEFIPPKPLRPVDEILVNAVTAMGDKHSRAVPNRKAINTREGTPQACVSTGMCTSGCPVGAVYKFSARLLPKIQFLKNYSLQTNAKVVRLIRESGTGRIREIEYLDTRTRALRHLKARIFVVCAGAVETPRILFNSADEMDPSGIGNRNDNLGRGLQDNPKAVLSTSLLRLWGKRRTYDIGYGDHLILMSRGRLPDGTDFPFIGHSIHGIPHVPHYLAGMKGIPAIVKEPIARLLFNSYVTLGVFCAGDPNRENRVRPGKTFDCFGVRQVEIDFTVSARTKAMIASMSAWGRKVLRRATATSIYATSDSNGTGIHYAGTTAISDGPANGVVDANLKVHGLENLYICDGGVIPVLPDKHLTLTIMALSHRLSAQIVERINGEGRPAEVMRPQERVARLL